jgi:apolipoprotein N-acyltransferase
MTTVEVAAGQVEEPVAEPPPPGPRPVPGWLGVVAALGAGAALLAAFPPANLWWLAPIGVALLAIAVHRRGFWAGTGLGALAGLSFFVPLLSWTDIVGGHGPWLILAALEAGYVALMAGVAARLSALVERYRWLWPLGTGLLWVAQEALRDRYPFGGFPWGRLAFSQGDSPLLRLAALGGAPLVTFAVALAGGLLAAAAWRPWRRGVAQSGAARGGAARGGAVQGGAARGGLLLVAALALVLGSLLVPTSRPTGPAVTVAVVQGNVPRLGLGFNEQRRKVLDNHAAATRELARQVAAGTAKQPDLVVWPENASDIDPLISADSDARAVINQAADAIKAPILVGAVLEGPGEHSRNAALVWQPGTGPDEKTYVKRHPVPFAEYMPLRKIARLVTDRVDLVRSDFAAGDQPGVLRVGPATVGDVICFEVAYDNIVRDTVIGGAGLLTVQTNNADFNTAEARQQLAMVRLRAVEHGRDALMASTVGVSAFVGADAAIYDATRFNTPAVLVRELRLGQERTLASVIGPVPEYMLVGLGFAVLGWAGLRHRRPRSKTQEAL